MMILWADGHWVRERPPLEPGETRREGGRSKGHNLRAAVCGNVLIRGFVDTVVNLLPTIPYQ